MEVVEGKTRKVYVFDKIVVKIAMIYWKAAISNFRFWWKLDKRKFIMIVKEFVWGDYYNYNFHPKTNLFAGIRANLLEFIFYLRYRNVFCQPTYFTFFGLINIQKKGLACEISVEEFKPRMHQLTNNEIPFKDHTFDSPSNFTVNNGHLQCIDYADPIIQPIILKYGKKLYNEFIVL